jgi:hypothetical protein
MVEEMKYKIWERKRRIHVQITGLYGFIIQSSRI